MPNPSQEKRIKLGVDIGKLSNDLVEINNLTQRNSELAKQGQEEYSRILQGSIDLLNTKIEKLNDINSLLQDIINKKDIDINIHQNTSQEQNGEIKLDTSDFETKLDEILSKYSSSDEKVDLSTIEDKLDRLIDSNTTEEKYIDFSSLEQKLKNLTIENNSEIDFSSLEGKFDELISSNDLVVGVIGEMQSTIDSQLNTLIGTLTGLDFSNLQNIDTEKLAEIITQTKEISDIIKDASDIIISKIEDTNISIENKEEQENNVEIIDYSNFLESIIAGIDLIIDEQNEIVSSINDNTTQLNILAPSIGGGNGGTSSTNLSDESIGSDDLANMAAMIIDSLIDVGDLINDTLSDGFEAIVPKLDEISDNLNNSGNGANININDTDSSDNLESGGENNESQGGGGRSGSNRKQQAANIVNQTMGNLMKKNDVYALAAFASMIPYIGQGFAQLLTGVLEAAEERQKGAAKATAATGGNIKFGGLSGLGLSAAQSYEKQAQYYPANIKLSVSDLTFEKGWNLNSGTLSSLMSSVREDVSQRQGGMSSADIGVRFLNQIASGIAPNRRQEVRGYAEEYLKLLVSLNQEQLETTGKTNSLITGKVVEGIASVSDKFANPVVLQKMVEGIKQGLSEANSPQLEALQYVTLSEMNPNASLWDLTKMKENPFEVTDSKGRSYLENYLEKLITNTSGQDLDMAKFNIQAAFQLPANLVDELVNGFVKSREEGSPFLASNYRQLFGTWTPGATSEMEQRTAAWTDKKADIGGSIAPFAYYVNDNLIAPAMSYIGNTLKEFAETAVSEGFLAASFNMIGGLLGDILNGVLNLGGKVVGDAGESFSNLVSGNGFNTDRGVSVNEGQKSAEGNAATMGMLFSYKEMLKQEVSLGIRTQEEADKLYKIAAQKGSQLSKQEIKYQNQSHEAYEKGEKWINPLSEKKRVELLEDMINPNVSAEVFSNKLTPNTPATANNGGSEE